MATNHGLRHVNGGPASGGHFVVLRVVSLAALATIGAATAIFAALLVGATHHDNGPAPRFLHAALGETKQSNTLPTRTLARMRSSVTRDGVRVAAPWARLSLTSLDAGSSPWRTYEGGSSRTTAFGTETVTLSGVSAEEFLTVAKHQGSRTWKWRLGTTLKPHLRDGTVFFTDRAGKTVLLRVGQPAILDAHGKRIDVPAHWGLSGRVLTLALDDAKLSLPYTIDPSISLSGAAFTTVKGSGQNGNFALTIPAGAQAGDLLVVQAVVRSTTAPTIPSATPAWTVLTSQSDATNGLEQYIYTRVMSAGDVAGTTSYTWTVGTAVDAAGGMLARRRRSAARACRPRRRRRCRPSMCTRWCRRRRPRS